MTDAPTAATIVDWLDQLYQRCGSEEYLGEDVTVAEHMLQCARLAEAEGASDQLIAAALLHDVGHFTRADALAAQDRGEDLHHEDSGAALVEPFFPQVVVDGIRHHVAAKRYLCATDPDYFARLSDASVHTLNLQGGPMDDAEAAAFAKNPNLDAILQVRRWDDAGKVAGHDCPPFSHYAPVLERVVRAHVAGGRP